MGFKTDQFYGLTGSVDKNGIGSRDRDQSFTNRNDRFIFPGPTHHWVDRDGVMRDHKVERGFMKMLPITKDKTFTDDWATRQLFFQFNPQTIRRAVSMRTDMMNPLLQDPGQFAVPVPGNATFTFDLMFDRSFELNNVLDAGANGFLANDTPLTTEQIAANQIGVLHDIKILDEIVGQGISQDMIDYIVTQGNITYNATAKSSGASPEYAWDETKVRDNLQQNVGNQAFLIPNPVRVVFSSLYMVDGFVQSMDVAYVKFTRSMIPQQVVIQITMQALYLGFARKKTFLTYSLENAVPVDLSDPSVVPDSTSTGQARSDLEALIFSPDCDLRSMFIAPVDALAASIDDYGPWSVRTVYDDRTGIDEATDLHYSDPAYFKSQEYLDGSRYVFNHPGDENQNGRCRHPHVAGETHLVIKHGFTNVTEDDSKDLIYQQFSGGSTGIISKISWSWDIKGYRKQLEGDSLIPSFGSFSNKSGEGDATQDVLLFTFKYESGDISTGEAWTEQKQLNQKITNDVLGSQEHKIGWKLYIESTDRMWLDGNTDGGKGFWDDFIAQQDGKIRMVANVKVTVTDRDGGTIVLNGTVNKTRSLDQPIWAEVSLSEKTASVGNGPSS